MIFPTIELEEKLWKQGFVNVAGVDEAGRGPLAGPVVAGAVIIHSKDQMVEGVRDSKKMTQKQREKCFELIIQKSSAYGVGIVSNDEIDKIGIQKAVLKAMTMALEQIKEKIVEINYIIADGKNVSIIEGYKMERITKGDLFHYSISAGSVLAKVTRDRIMREYAAQFPNYNFEKHVGYGTKKHMEALKKFGICKIHRKTFEPIKSMLKENN